MHPNFFKSCSSFRSSPLCQVPPGRDRACPAFDGRGRGWVRMTGRVEFSKNHNLHRRNFFGNQFCHTLSRGCEKLRCQFSPNLTFLSLWTYFKAPLPIKSRQGAIGRGRGRVRKTGNSEKGINLKFLKYIFFENQFWRPLSRGDRLNLVQRFNQGCVTELWPNFSTASVPPTPRTYPWIQEPPPRAVLWFSEAGQKDSFDYWPP